MNLLAKLRAHLQKIAGTIGAVVLTLDLTPIGAYANQFLPMKWAQKVGIALFILVTVRAWYVSQKK